MLKSLQIKNFAIIEQTILDLQNGLTVLTGETGAGKSILLDAMGLILGNRADSSMVRFGTKKADITATFDLSKLEHIKQTLENLDLENDDDECIIRRVVQQDGKSKAYINGIPCTLNTLSTITENLVDIHGQHDHQLLIKSKKQLSWLDQQLSNPCLLQQVKEGYQAWFKTKTELDDLINNQQQQTEDLDRYQFSLQELQSLNPVEGEIEEIEQEHQQQANAEQLTDNANQAFERLSSGKDAILSQLSNVFGKIQNIENLDKGCGLSANLIEQSLIELEDQSNSIQRYLNSIEIDPKRLSFLETRIASYQNLAFKHHCSAKTLYQKTAELETKIDSIGHYDENIKQLTQILKDKTISHRTLVLELSELRQKTANSLSNKITEIMQTLAMKGGQFKIQVNYDENAVFAPNGNDKIQFLVSANPGQPLKDLKKVASGGELSRISLAMQMVANQDSLIATLIFDEVDAGIGGETANIVGKLLRKLGTNTQSLCVTHLPQVAAKGHQHLKVDKTVVNEQTQTQLSPLDEQLRIDEIARMLAGDLTASSLEHAKEMLNL